METTRERTSVNSVILVISVATASLDIPRSNSDEMSEENPNAL